MSTCVALVMVSSPMNLSSRSKAVFSARPEINLLEIWIQRDDHMFADSPDFFEDVFIEKQKQLVNIVPNLAIFEMKIIVRNQK